MLNSTPHIDLSLIWVHYHTPELLLDSLEKAQQELADMALQFEIIVVDNGGVGDVLNTHIDDNFTVITNPQNLGYAGGINQGLAAARGHSFIILNPDVLMEPGCIQALLTALQTSGIVAPTLFLDHNKVFRLPANERRDFVSASLRELAQGSALFSKIARKRWRKHVHRAPAAKTCYELSGAILCFTRRAWQSIGAWDETYQLYFEESEWLQRAKRQNVNAAYAPLATAVHLYAQSTQQEPQSQRWFAQSLARYEKQHYAAWQRWLIYKLRRWSSNRKIKQDSREYKAKKQPAASAELSDSGIGFPAALIDLKQQTDFSIEDAQQLLAQIPNADYRLRWVAESHKELGLDKISL